MTRPHFLGTEASPSPLVPELLQVAQALAEADVPDAVVSARYGPRAVVNAAGVPVGMLGEAHFVEIADYDPLTDQVLCLGAHAPHAGAPVHALVYRAKKEVNVIVQVDLPAGRDAPEDVPHVERGKRALDTAMAVLEQLRTHDAVRVGDRSVLVAGERLAPVVERAKALAGIAESGEA